MFVPMILSILGLAELSDRYKINEIRQCSLLLAKISFAVLIIFFFADLWSSLAYVAIVASILISVCTVILFLVFVFELNKKAQ